MPRVFMHVQHLLGIGHLRRSAALARQLTARGHRVTLASGGRTVPDLDVQGIAFIQLPSLRARHSNFSDLVDEQDQPIDAAWRSRRRELLLAAFRAAQPDLLITETFPFGRRMLRFELLPLLALAAELQPKPLVVASVRDILQPKPHREADMLAQARERYQRVLVHGDARLASLDLSFGAADQLADMIGYGGYLDSASSAAAGEADAAEVLVSVGGGAMGERLLTAALAARPLSSLSAAPWRVRVGHNLPEARFQKLRAAAAEGLIVERNQPDFAARVQGCRLSVSQAGYNTMVDLLRGHSPALLVPYSGGKEREQLLRAERLEALGRACMLREEGLSAEALATAMDRAVGHTPAELAVHIDRGERAVELLESWLLEPRQ